MKMRVLHEADATEDFEVGLDAADLPVAEVPMLPRRQFIATIGDAVGDKLTLKTEKED